MILLDTCVLYWLEQEPGAISTAVAAELKRPEVPFYASAISAFELGLKVHAGRLKFSLPVADWLREVCRRRQIVLLPVNEAVAGSSTELPWVHRDPCDRFLIATAQLHRLRLATPDPHIAQYPNLQTIW